jgi:hypothetical protein
MSNHHFSRAFAAFVLASLPAATSVADTEVPTLQRLATVDTSDIVVGRVVGTSAVNTGTKGVETRVEFEVVHVVDGPLSPSQRITVAQPGGRTADRSLDVSDQPLWTVGDTYLLCLGRRTDGMFALPFVREGQFRVVNGHDGVPYALGFGDRPVRRISNGHLLYAPRALDVLEGQARVDREPYLAADPVDLTPGGAGRTWRTELGDWAEAMTLDQFTAVLSNARGTVARPAGRLDGVATISAISSAGLPMCWCGYQPLYEVFEQVPSSWDCYGPNEWMMAQFNHYLDLVRYSADDGSWAWANGTDELTGFPSSADLVAAFGASAAWSAGGRGVTFSSTGGTDCASIIEADIGCNPAKIFVFDFDSSFNTSDHWHYQKTIVHEMGHALGLFRGNYCGSETYQFNRPTIMFNNQTYQVEYAKGIHRSDFNALKNLYGAQTSPKNVYDMGIESYYGDGPIINSTVSPAVVQQGGILTVSNFFVENICKNVVPGVRVRVYLSTNKTISTSDYLLGADVDFGDFCVNCDWLGNVTRTVPSTVPFGKYYVGLMVTHGGDAHTPDTEVTANDTTWLPTQVTVLPSFNGWFPPGDTTAFSFSLTKLLSAVLAIETNGAGDDAAPPTCGGTTMGPSIFATFVAPESGVLSVGPSGSQGPSNDLVPGGWMVAAYEGSSTSGNYGQPLGVACGDFAQAFDPLRVSVTAGRSYVLRFGSTGPGAISAPFGVAIAPARQFGSAPELPLPFVGTMALSNASMPDVTLTLPCAPRSSRGFWQSWHAPANGLLTVDTCRAETNFANAVSIHPASAPGNVLACGVTGGMTSCSGQYGAQASVNVVGGQDYLIRVGTMTTQAGQFATRLRFNAASVDNATCARAIQVQAGSVQPFATDGGSSDPVLRCDGSSTTGRGTWFKFTATAVGRLRATTCPDLGGSASDASSVTVFANCPSATAGVAPVACDNDACDGTTRGASVQMGVGQSVFVRVSSEESGIADAAIQGQLAFVFETSCIADFTNDRIVNGADLGTLLSKWGAQIPSGSPDSYLDLNGDGQINGGDLGVLLSKWGACP